MQHFGCCDPEKLSLLLKSLVRGDFPQLQFFFLFHDCFRVDAFLGGAFPIHRHRDVDGCQKSQGNELR